MARINPYYNPDKPHHTPTGFCNLAPWQHDANEFRRWRRERMQNRYPKAPVGGYAEFARRWQRQADFSYQGDAVWWLGHSTVLLRVGGVCILTDPVLGRWVSPVSFAGPKRRTHPGARARDLPTIDVVLLSHNHYDHMDKNTIMQLARRFPDALFLAPLGLKKWLKRQGVRRAEELDWWQNIPHLQASFICVPAQHWSLRTPWDRNRTLWGGWVMQMENFRFYFAGDTAYASHLAQIGQRLGPFDLAALPIGAYAPRWFMHHNHVDPEEAVRLHKELGCKRSLGIHWATFELADEPLDEPVYKLAEALKQQGCTSEEFQVIPIGERWMLD